jgi:hypothetical protein
MLADLVKELNLLSDGEIEELELALKNEKASRQTKEILEAAKQARQESTEGKTYAASTPEEIIQ